MSNTPPYPKDGWINEAGLAPTTLREPEGSITSDAHSQEVLRPTENFEVIANQKADQLKAAITDKTDDLKQHAKERWESANVKLKDLQTSGETFIREKPLTVVLAALGVGLLVGLTSRR